MDDRVREFTASIHEATEEFLKTGATQKFSAAVERAGNKFLETGGCGKKDLPIVNLNGQYVRMKNYG